MAKYQKYFHLILNERFLDKLIKYNSIWFPHVYYVYNKLLNLKKYLSQNHKQNDEDKGEIKVFIFAEYVILFLRDTKDRTR